MSEVPQPASDSPSTKSASRNGRTMSAADRPAIARVGAVHVLDEEVVELYPAGDRARVRTTNDVHVRTGTRAGARDVALTSAAIDRAEVARTTVAARDR